MEQRLTIQANGITYVVHLRELRGFLEKCNSFMETSETEFDLMSENISYSILENANSNIRIEDLRAQLLYLNEIKYLIKGLISLL